MDPSRVTATVRMRSRKPISFGLKTGKKEKDASLQTGCHSRGAAPPSAPAECSEPGKVTFFVFPGSISQDGKLRSSTPECALCSHRWGPRGLLATETPGALVSLRVGASHRHGSGVTLPLTGTNRHLLSPCRHCRHGNQLQPGGITRVPAGKGMERGLA